jgi:putative ABC transport system substrate-binding protein
VVKSKAVAKSFGFWIARFTSNKVVSFALCALLTPLGFSVEAQSTKLHRIAVLVSGSPSSHKYIIDAILQGLREYGYIENKNTVIDYRYAEGKPERFSELAAQLARLNPDVVIVAGNRAARSMKAATSTIPIVVGSGGHLVGTGLVSSLAKPGGNVTGSTSIAPDLSGKRLELLKEIVPKASNIAVLVYGGKTSGDWDEVRQTESAAQQLKVKIQPVEIQNPKDFQSAYTLMTNNNAHALIIILGFFTNSHRRELLQLATKSRLPSICEQSEWAKDGCLVSYGPDVLSLYRRSAYFVDKVLKGTKPADLPVEQPMKFEFVINLKTAKQIGLTIPPNVLARADRVIR